MILKFTDIYEITDFLEIFAKRYEGEPISIAVCCHNYEACLRVANTLNHQNYIYIREVFDWGTIISHENKKVTIVCANQLEVDRVRGQRAKMALFYDSDLIDQEVFEQIICGMSIVVKDPFLSKVQ